MFTVLGDMQIVDLTRPLKAVFRTLIILLVLSYIYIYIYIYIYTHTLKGYFTVHKLSKYLSFSSFNVSIYVVCFY